MASQLHTSALTIKPVWCRLILSGQKVLELRAFQCKVRGAVPILESGTSCVTGVVQSLGRGVDVFAVV